MASTFFRRLSKATPVSFGGQPKSTFGAIAAVTGGISYLYYYNSPNLVISHLGFLSNHTHLFLIKWIL